MAQTAIVTGGTNGILQAEALASPETLNGPLLLANQAAAPAAVAGAAQAYSLAGQPQWENPQGLTGAVVGCQGGLTAAGTAITTTTAETVLMTMSLPAADAIAGSVYEQTGYGVFSTTGSPGSTVFTARLGGVAGTSLAATANITLGTSLTNAQWRIRATLNFLTATTAECVVDVLVNSAAAGAASAYLVAATSATTVSLSTAKTWVVTITPGASGTSIQQLGGHTLRLA
jgi:hypothetical protein